MTGGHVLCHDLKDYLSHYIDDVIDGALERQRIVGAVVLVSVDGRVVYRRAAGCADREQGRPMAEDAIFLLASVSKPIVSAAALNLVSRRMIGLEDPVTKWIPEFRPKTVSGREPRITIRHLLTHTSGLSYGFRQGSEFYDASGISSGLDCPGLPIEEALCRLASVPLLFDPGAAWNYSLSTDVLGEVLARASGTSLPEVVHSAITGPLSMKDTGFVVRDPDRFAVPYVEAMPTPVRMRDPHSVANRNRPIVFSPSRIFDPNSYPSGGAGMAGTAPEFLAFLEAIRCGGNPVMDPRSAVAFASRALPQNISFEELGWTFGFGAAVLEDTRLARTPHDPGTWRWGGAYGHDWFVNPMRKLSVVSFTNTTYEGVEGAFPVDLRDAVYCGICSAR